MQYSGVVFLLLAACAYASLNDNGIEGGDRIVLVAPVLAPPKNSGALVTTRSRQFPILVLLSQQNSPQPEAKSLSVNPEPVYVQKLEDQTDARPYRKLREKRTLKNKGGGGGGTTVVIVPDNGGGGRGQYGGGRGPHGGGRGQYGGGQGQYGGGQHGGGQYGGGGYSVAHAAATAGSYGSQGGCGGCGGHPNGGNYGGGYPRGGNYGGGGIDYASANANAYASGKR